jgi:UDP-N-acetylmuramoylalanine--D-glutamate ligase
VRLAVCFGEASQVLAEGFRGRGVETVAFGSLEEAVRAAFERTPEGGTLLFSPACSSFDAFANFRERAQAFRKLLPGVGDRSSPF